MKTTGYYMTHNRFLNSNLALRIMVIQETPASSNISRIGYDDQHGFLYVEFKSGKTYRYEEVSPDTWNQFLDAPSVGQFFAARVKNAYKGYEVNKIPALK